ncbi:uncharacterized protein LACBIDRAFT_333462 [Laccaria bicolor S238N-H82]|uniref:Predicted protein n=1 Tax=Laccaria bicolor (strain S238N-H82 / ATCC MYA-4686) TaxID=486041 RepID=B0DVZ9_LACBS|nr:uncharacterized protein LACBIDRAFT_333462 [Laccaria bicolor S238N-H82]EDR01223.1 predicted protein [Laccaria bicolor S238N-H82]|eukprot:XP_001888099.1 predicted protein [Laccaria bicolor S238N-H82]
MDSRTCDELPQLIKRALRSPTHQVDPERIELVQPPLSFLPPRSPLHPWLGPSLALRHLRLCRGMLPRPTAEGFIGGVYTSLCSWSEPAEAHEMLPKHITTSGPNGIITACSNDRIMFRRSRGSGTFIILLCLQARDAGLYLRCK